MFTEKAAYAGDVEIALLWLDQSIFAMSPIMHNLTGLQDIFLLSKRIAVCLQN